MECPDLDKAMPKVEEISKQPESSISSGVFTSSPSCSPSVSNATCLCQDILATADDKFASSLSEVAFNYINGLEQRADWLELANNIKDKDVQTSSNIRNTLKQFYSKSFQLEMSRLSDNQKLKNALIPLYLANSTKCQTHIEALKEAFQSNSNKLFHKIIQLGDKVNLHCLFFHEASFDRFSLQFMFDVVNDPTTKNTQFKYSWPFIHLAIYADELDIVKVLVEMNPNWKNEVTKDGRNPLMKAAQSRSFASFEFLLGLPSKPGINDRDNNQATAASLAACGFYSEENSIKTLKLLAANGANLRLKNLQGDTALMNAALYGKSGIIRYLLSQNPTRIEVEEALNKCKKKNQLLSASVLEEALQAMPQEETKRRSKIFGIF